MANNRLTWRDVSAPNMGGALAGMDHANRMFQSALGGLSNSLGNFATQQNAAREKAVLDNQIAAEAAFARQLAATLGNTEQQTELMRTLGSNPNVRTEFILEQIGKDRNSRLVGDTSYENLSQSKFDNNVTQQEQLAREQAQPLLARGLQLRAQGRDADFNALLAQNEGLLAGMSQKDQVDFMTGAGGQATTYQDIQTSQQGRRNTGQIMAERQQGMDQNDWRFNNEREEYNSKALVADRVAQARSTTPFVDEQQAMGARLLRSGELTPTEYAAFVEGIQGGNTPTSRTNAGPNNAGGQGQVGSIETPTSVLDPSNSETADLIASIGDVRNDINLGAGTTASNTGIARRDALRASDIAPNQVVNSILENAAFKEADPIEVNNALLELKRTYPESSFAEIGGAIAMTPGTGMLGGFKIDLDRTRAVLDQWNSLDMPKARDTQNERTRQAAKFDSAEQKLLKDEQKLNQLLTHALTNGLPIDSERIQNLQENIDNQREDLANLVQTTQWMNLGERVRSPSTGQMGYPQELLVQETRAAQARAEQERARAAARAEEDQRPTRNIGRSAEVEAQLRELERRLGISR